MWPMTGHSIELLICSVLVATNTFSLQVAPNMVKYKENWSAIIMDINFIREIRYEYLSLKKRLLSQNAYKDLSQEAQEMLTYIITVMSMSYLLKDINPFPLDQFFYKFHLEDYYEVTEAKTAPDSIIMQALEELCQTRYWIPLEDGGRQCVSWLKDVLISADRQVTVELHKFVGLGLVGLLDSIPDWDLKLQYSHRLYRFLKLHRTSEVVIEVTQMQNELKSTAPSYSRYSNFKQRILDPAVHEINNHTDICVRFSKTNINGAKGKKEALMFSVSSKLNYLKPDSTLRADAKKRLRQKDLSPSEVYAPPVEEVHGDWKRQSIQGAKKQFLLAEQTVDGQPSTPDESEMEDLPF